MTTDDNSYGVSHAVDDTPSAMSSHHSQGFVSAFVRYSIVVVSCFSVLYWLAFAARIYPWIVIADSDWSLARSFEEAGRGGLYLAVLSFAPPLLVIGKMLGHCRAVYIAAALLMVAWLAVAPWVFVEVRYRPGILINIRGTCYVIGLLLIAGGVSSPTHPFVGRTSSSVSIRRQ